MSVILETTKGDLTVDLYIKERPKSKSFTSHPHTVKIVFFNFKNSI